MEGAAEKGVQLCMCCPTPLLFISAMLLKIFELAFTVFCLQIRTPIPKLVLRVVSIFIVDAYVEDEMHVPLLFFYKNY